VPVTRLHKFLTNRHAFVAVILAVAFSAVGFIWGSHVAGGADSYGYISQADLWLSGHLVINQDFVADAPWSLARFSFAPLGYRPVLDGYGIVPIYSPGLPLMMAGAKLVAGQCGVFWIVPLCGFVFVMATYTIGRRIGRPLLGLAAAWFVATSPTATNMVVQPMSDIPASAAWAAAFAATLGESVTSALVAGVAAGIAILVRPNLLPLAILPLGFMVWQDVADRRWRSLRRVRSFWFVLPVTLAAVVVGMINSYLWGSPIRSGYGGVGELYDIWNAPSNLKLYTWWLVTT